jgi:hypothetical protein
VGYDADYGARPLKRAIQRELQDPLALKLLSGEFHEGNHPGGTWQGKAGIYGAGFRATRNYMTGTGKSAQLNRETSRFPVQL